MNGYELLRIWEDRHGKLSDEHKAQFLSSAVVQEIRKFKPEDVHAAVDKNNKVVEILAELKRDAKDSRPVGQLSIEKDRSLDPAPSPARRKKEKFVVTRAIARQEGRGFKQAEEDARKWRGRF